MFFELLLFVLFIVVPIVNRLRRGSQNQNQRPGQGQTGQGQTGQGQAGQRSTNQGQNRQGQATSNRSQASPNETFRKRLEEARQRVLEAERTNQQGTPSQQGQPRQTTQANTPSRPPLVPVETAKSDRRPVDEPVLAQKDDRRVEGYGVSLEGKSLGGTSLETPSKSTKTSTQKGTRKGTRKDPKQVRVTRKRSKRIMLEVNRDALMQGIIWREIFNDPVSKRPKRTIPRRKSSAQQPRP